MNTHRIDALLRDCGKVCEALQIGVWEYNQTQDIIIGNDVFWKLLGEAQTPQWTFKNYLDRIHSQDRNMVQTYWKRTYDTQVRNGVVFRVKQENGTMHWLKKTMIPHHKNSQEIIHGVLMDVTDEQEAVHKLSRRTQRLKGFVDNMPGAAYVALNDETYTMLYVSHAIEQLTGYTSEQFVTHDVVYNDLIHPDDRAKVRNTIRDIVKHQTRLDIEYRIITKTGETKWVFEQGTPDHDDDSNVNHVSGVIIDISKRKQLDEALMMERQKLRKLVKSTADIIFEIDCNKVFVSVYGKGLEKFGLTPSDFESMTVLDVFGQDGESRDHYYQEALDGKNVTYNWTYDTGKQVLHYHSSISPMRDTSGKIIGAVGIAREITKARKQALKNEYLSHHDPLTDLYNRHYLYEVIERELHRASRYEEKLSMIVIDIDDFKNINDRFGHIAGDTLIKQVAQCFKQTLRKSDLVFRTGGEEFLLVLPKTTVEAASKLANRIRHEVTRLKLDYETMITCSFGVGEKFKEETFEGWWKRTDDAMRVAKKQGKNRVVHAA